MTHDDTHEARGATVDLAQLADQLVSDLAHHPAGRTARTVVSGSVVRAALIALREGVQMAEHDSPSGATLYCIRGEVTLRCADREWRVRAGELVAVPPQRHAVEAHVDSAFLLTVALR